LDEGDWKFAVEMEAILSVGKDLVVMAQTETKLNAAYGPVLRKDAHKKYTAETMMVIDVDNWKNTTRASRIPVDVNTFFLKMEDSVG